MQTHKLAKHLANLKSEVAHITTDLQNEPSAQKEKQYRVKEQKTMDTKEEIKEEQE
jgi:hypothetical protein